MGYKATEEYSEDFFYWNTGEEKKIKDFLKELGYNPQSNHVCGQCCGMYEDMIYIDGIGRGWKNKNDIKKFQDFITENNIECGFPKEVGEYLYTISANKENNND